MTNPADVCNQLFCEARTHFKWKDEPVSETQLRALYDLIKWGPTSANSTPARILFVRSPEAKERLRPHLSQGNVAKTMTAPVTAIIGYDLAFHDFLPRLFAHDPGIRSVFADPANQARTEKAAYQNSCLQGGYLIVAARLLGLDCGPMSGFDAPGVDAEFWAGTAVRTNFLCNLGYGDSTALFPRLPRLAFDEVCAVL